jgi:protein-tyrosine phosphatase
MGFFSNIFSKKVVLPPADLSVLKTDIHSHFLPRLDDGSQSSKETIELLKKMEDFGYKKVITTPHVMSDYYKNTSQGIKESLEKLQPKLIDAGVKIKIEVAAEYYLDDFFSQKIDNKDLLTFGDNYVLFELPFVSEPRSLHDDIFKMQMAGYKPVLAHPERYSFWYKNFESFEKLKDKGVYFQLNINSLSSHYPPETKKTAEKIAQAGMINFLGSDCHNIHHVDWMNEAIKEPIIHQLIESGEMLNATL